MKALTGLVETDQYFPLFNGSGYGTDIMVQAIFLERCVMNNHNIEKSDIQGPAGKTRVATLASRGLHFTYKEKAFQWFWGNILS